MSGPYVDATAGAVEHCESMSIAHPDLAERYYNRMAIDCQQKLWHQLTLTVMDLLSHYPDTARTTEDGGVHSYLALYDKVVLAVESKLKPLSVARIAAAVANAVAVSDLAAAKAILENLLSKMSHASVSSTGNTVGSSMYGSASSSTPAKDVSAMVYLQSKLGLLTLHSLTEVESDSSKEALAQIKKSMLANQALLTEMIVTNSNVDQATVQAAHYEQAAQYYKVLGPPSAFYEQTMHFLNYAPLPTDRSSKNAAAGHPHLPGVTNYHQLAVDLCLAALTADNVYNLGQVVEQQKPLLQLLLQGDPDDDAVVAASATATTEGRFAWLVHLLQACADGDVARFGQLTNQYQAQIAQQPALVHRSTAVQEKLALLALVRLSFEKASHERILSFSEIAAALQLPDIDQVEWVVMRALSVHLMEGKMDQVEQTMHVTWVLPRVLNVTQLQALSERFGSWAVKVSQTTDYMKEQTPTLA